MILDRSVGHEETVRDLAVSELLSQQLEDLDLAEGQGIDQRLADRARRIGGHHPVFGASNGRDDSLHRGGLGALPGQVSQQTGQ